MSAYRPTTLDEFKGQDALKRRLRIAVAAAKGRGGALPHTLLAGPPGLGKTTLANVLAKEMGSRLRVIQAPSITSSNTLRRLIAGVKLFEVFFLDEIHGLNRDVEELLYPVAEDFRLEVVIDGRARRLALPEFTIIGATTRRGDVSRPMRDRFQLIESMSYYTAAELAEIVHAATGAKGWTLSDEAELTIAERGRGVPRVAIRLAARVMDYAVAHEFNRMAIIDAGQTEVALEAWGIDELGLDPLDNRVLRALAVTFEGGPVGVSSIALAVGETVETIADAVEPYLTRLGLMARTPSGRVAMPKAYDHLGIQHEGAA